MSERITGEAWASLTDPLEMLRALPPETSDRKLCLFVCECYRPVRGRLDKADRTLLNVLERYADSHACLDELADAWGGSQLALDPQTGEPRRYPWSRSCHHALALESVDRAARLHSRDAAAQPWDKDLHRARRRQCALLRELFGDPFRPVVVEASWLTSNGQAVRHLAREIYQRCRFQELPILADALEEAGCQDEAILTHCRAPAEHVRGCWVVDALLGKE
ncbi:MAG: hypothetical protein L0Z62_26320 [Gemmataceae bacterium]|nr:hypothetical protein [Gemmataceae bacterium]